MISWKDLSRGKYYWRELEDLNTDEAYECMRIWNDIVNLVTPEKDQHIKAWEFFAKANQLLKHNAATNVGTIEE